MKHLLEVEKGREAADGRPSVGPAYRSAFAKDGFPPPIPGVDSCWDVFRYAFIPILPPSVDLDLYLSPSPLLSSPSSPTLAFPFLNRFFFRRKYIPCLGRIDASESDWFPPR